MYTLAHLHVICRDMEKMIRFWREALSAEVVASRTFGDEPGAIMESLVKGFGCTLASMPANQNRVAFVRGPENLMLELIEA